MTDQEQFARMCEILTPRQWEQVEELVRQGKAPLEAMREVLGDL